MHKYRLVAKKGEGTFSEVLKAQCVKSGKYVAIKCMKNKFDSMDQVNSLREIQALRRLSPHAHVIKLLEVLYDQPTGRLALVFELMDMNIYELIRGRRHYVADDRVKLFMYQLLKAMDHMHRNGIFHRDIKPENILIMDDALKLADFGSCRGVYSKQPYTEYISTRWYRAPECLLTDGYYNYKMDMWGVGCVMFEVVALFPLFPGTNELDQIAKIHNVLGTPPPSLLAKLKRRSQHMAFDFPQQEGTGVTKLLAHCSQDCQDLVSRLLAYNPDERLSARQALRHPYFRELREAEKRQKAMLAPDIQGSLLAIDAERRNSQGAEDGGGQAAPGAFAAAGGPPPLMSSRAPPAAAAAGAFGDLQLPGGPDGPGGGGGGGGAAACALPAIAGSGLRVLGLQHAQHGATSGSFGAPLDSSRQVPAGDGGAGLAPEMSGVVHHLAAQSSMASMIMDEPSSATLGIDGGALPPLLARGLMGAGASTSALHGGASSAHHLHGGGGGAGAHGVQQHGHGGARRYSIGNQSTAQQQQQQHHHHHSQQHQQPPQQAAQQLQLQQQQYAAKHGGGGYSTAHAAAAVMAAKQGAAARGFAGGGGAGPGGPQLMGHHGQHLQAQPAHAHHSPQQLPQQQVPRYARHSNGTSSMGPGSLQHAAAAAAAAGLVGSASTLSVASGMHRLTNGGGGGGPAAGAGPRRTNQGGAYVSPYSQRMIMQRNGGEG